MHLLRRWLLLAGILLPVLACDDYSHDGVVNTPPVNFVLLTRLTTYGGPNYDWATALAPLSSGSWLLVGATNSWGYGPTTLYVVQVDPSGQSAWHVWKGGWGEDCASAVAVDNAGNIVCTGHTESFDLTTGAVIDPTSGKPIEDQNIYLVKITPDGEPDWHHAYGDSLNVERAVGLLVLPDGYLVAGYQIRTGYERDLFLVRTELNGDLRWQKALMSTAIDSVTSTIPTYDGGLAIAGYTRDVSRADADAAVWKVDADGDLVWHWRLDDTTTSTILCDIAETTGHDLLVTGRSRPQPFSNPDNDELFVARVDADGAGIWQGQYPQTAIREGRGVCESGSGAVFVCGQQKTDNAIMLCKFLANGTLAWSDSSHAGGFGMALAPLAGGFIIAGSTTYPDKRELNDMLLITVQEDLTNIK